MKTNGLEYKSIKSLSKPVIISDDNSILDYAPEKAWFITYLDHRVVIGRLINKTWSYHKQENNDVILQNIQKLRIFNENEELFIWRTNLGGHKARIRIDGTGVEQGVVDAQQVLFGTKAEMLDYRYAKLTEKRGTEIIIPIKDLSMGVNEINEGIGRLCVHTRSYIGTIEATGQATYEDVRFIEFVKYRED
jgi:CRISPR-associated protein (TIGR03984 family)